VAYKNPSKYQQAQDKVAMESDTFISTYYADKQANSPHKKQTKRVMNKNNDDLYQVEEEDTITLEKPAKLVSAGNALSKYLSTPAN